MDGQSDGPEGAVTWASLFERAEAADATERDVTEALAAVREGDD